MFYLGSPPPRLRPQRFGFFSLLFSLLQNMALRALHLPSYNHEEVQDLYEAD
jgi:hypothetical protein